MTSFLRSFMFGLATLLACGAAYADNGMGQDPPKEPEKKECIADTGGFRMNGKSATYTVELQNLCERRLRCKVAVFVTTAFGPAQGQGTLTLAPHAAGDAARKTYALKVKAMGGMAQVSRSCEAI